MSNLLSVKLYVRDSTKQGVKNFAIRGKYINGAQANLEKTVEKISDEHGYVMLQLLPGAQYDISVMNTAGTFEHNATISTDIAAKKPFVIIGLSNPINSYISSRELRVVDQDEKPVAHCKYKMVYLSQTTYSTVGSDGKQIIQSLVGEPVTITLLKPNNSEVTSATFTYISRKIKESNFKLKVPIHQTQQATAPNNPISTPVPTPPIQSCGIQFHNRVKCTRYNGRYGPQYSGSHPLSGFTRWDDMVNQGLMTIFDKNVMISVAPNEGNLDAVQSYDDQLFTAGAMQKTIAPNGKGELSTQMADFKAKYPQLFTQYFSNCGWDVTGTGSNAIASYNGLQGQAFKTFVRAGCDVHTFGHTIPCPAVESMISAITTTEYIYLQVIDFIKRLNRAIVDYPVHSGTKHPHIHVTSSYSYKISEYVISELGRATILDHSINRPAYPKFDFGTALNTFYHHNPHVSQNPAEWGEHRAQYERSILDHYGPSREMTDAANRYQGIKNVLHSLGIL